MSAKEKVIEALGITEDEFDQLVRDCIDAYNADESKSVAVSMHAAIPLVRKKMLDDESEISRYEKVLAGVMFSMGKGFVTSKVKNVLDVAAAKALGGVPESIAIGELITSLIKIVGQLQPRPDKSKPCTNDDGD
jgi:hypothetical protein